MVTAERDQKRLLFIPVHHSSVTDKIQSYGNVLKQNFMVISTKEIEDGAFEFVFDPREDFEAVIDFVKAQSVREQ